MKFLTIVFLLFMTCWANAQTTPTSVKTQLMKLLEAKHNVERISTFPKLDPVPSREKYVMALGDMIKNRDSVIKIIDVLLLTDSAVLNKKTLWYNWNNPVSSHIDLNSRISYSYYLKIVKYSLEKQMNILPPLKYVPF